LRSPLARTFSIVPCFNSSASSGVGSVAWLRFGHMPSRSERPTSRPKRRVPLWPRLTAACATPSGNQGFAFESAWLFRSARTESCCTCRVNVIRWLQHHGHRRSPRKAHPARPERRPGRQPSQNRNRWSLNTTRLKAAQTEKSMESISNRPNDSGDDPRRVSVPGKASNELRFALIADVCATASTTRMNRNYQMSPVL
jgi:hypothetical protein